jgi:hypothetical protein
VISTIDGTASVTRPKNSRQTVRVTGGILCSTHTAEVIRPSVAFLLHAGDAGEELVGDVLAQALLAEQPPGTSSCSSPSFFAARRVGSARGGS